MMMMISILFVYYMRQDVVMVYGWVNYKLSWRVLNWLFEGNEGGHKVLDLFVKAHKEDALILFRFGTDVSGLKNKCLSVTD